MARARWCSTFVFWVFGFLRMGTTGLTDQARVSPTTPRNWRLDWERALLIAAVVGVALIALQWPIRELAFALIAGSERVEDAGATYFEIRIWAAPGDPSPTAAGLVLIGLGRARYRPGAATGAEPRQHRARCPAGARPGLDDMPAVALGT